MIKPHSFSLEKHRKRCQQFRKRILDISQTVKAIHAAGAFSSIEMVDLIYYGLMRKNKKFSFKDTFLMSKGHGCMAQYVILEKIGILSKKKLQQYGKIVPKVIFPEPEMP